MSDVDSEQLGFFGKLMKILKDYGIAKTLIGIGVLCLVVWALNSSNTIDRLVNHALDQRNEVLIQDEIEAIDQRISIQDKVDEVLECLLDDTNADRAFIFEMHNGTNNTAGLPFAFAEVTYEATRHNVDDISDEYAKLILTKYKLPLIIYRDGYWHGTTEQLINVDRKFGAKVLANDANYVMFIRLNGLNRGNTIGFLGISFVRTQGPTDVLKSRNDLIGASQRLAILLDTVVTDGD